MITDYTTYDDIRAVLGVPSEELPDEVLALETYSLELDKSMSSMSGEFETETRTLKGHFEYLKALPTPTDEQQEMLNTLTLFAVYSASDRVANNISMFAPKTRSEGKASITRFVSPETYQSIKRGIKERLGTLRTELNVAFGIPIEDVDYIQIIEPATDPVLGG